MLTSIAYNCRAFVIACTWTSYHRTLCGMGHVWILWQHQTLCTHPSTVLLPHQGSWLLLKQIPFQGETSQWRDTSEREFLVSVSLSRDCLLNVVVALVWISWLIRLFFLKISNCVSFVPCSYVDDSIV